MIVYNMRERGPLEYDKFTLNTLTLFNIINSRKMYEQDIKNKESLISKYNEINKKYENLVGSKNKKGIKDTIYLESYKFRGV